MEVQISETLVICDKNIGRHVALIYTCTSVWMYAGSKCMHILKFTRGNCSRL